ncbi:MAG: adenosylhomocysteinase [Candidatus Atribacteria bacterium]
MNSDYEIKDISLAAEGRKRINWVSQHMPILNTIKSQFIKEKPFQDKRIAISVHLEAKTAYLALVMKSGGAEVAVTGSNPYSTKDEVTAVLAEEGIKVYAQYGVSEDIFKYYLNRVLDIKPHLIIDDGAELVSIVSTERKELQENVWGAAEETTSGVIRLQALEKEGKLAFPVIRVNDAYMKCLFDNRYGTGQSVWDAIMRTTNLNIAGKTVVVIGYGWCGKGISSRGQGLGAEVIITEINPIRAIEARMDGFKVMKLEEAVPYADILITATGNKDVLAKKHMEKMKDKAILANAGHFDVEISKRDLEELAVQKRNEVRRNIDEYILKDGRRIYLLAQGTLVNISAGDGHPVEIMDLSFALQALSIKYVNDHYKELENRLYRVPEEIDQKVAWLMLEASGIKIDVLTPDQKRYLQEWKI